MRATIPAVDKALRAKGYPDSLCNGEGYFYFYGPDAETWYSSSVYVFLISHLGDVDRWVEAYESLRSQYHEARKGL